MRVIAPVCLILKMVLLVRLSEAHAVLIVPLAVVEITLSLIKEDCVMTTRERSYMSQNTADYLRTFHKIGPGCAEPESLTTDFSGTMVTEEMHVTMTDVVTPRFTKLRSEGKIINNPMTKTTVIDKEGLCYTRARVNCRFSGLSCSPPKTYYFEDDDFCGTLPSSVLINYYNKSIPAKPSWTPDTLISQAITKSWAKVGDTSIQSLVCLAEAEKTVLSLASIFRRFIKVIKMIKRLDGYHLAKEFSAKQLSDRYMELRYAIRPLLYDAVGLIEALDSDREKPRSTFRGTVQDGLQDSTTSTQPITYTGAKAHGWTLETRTAYELFAECKAGVLTEMAVEGSPWNTWGITQPFESAWELVPFSFIVDWFFNVGDTIAAWTPNYGFHVLASWYTLETIWVRRVDLKYTDVWYTPSQSFDWIDCDGILDNCFVEKTEIVKTRVPDPSRSIVPSIKLRINTFKLADLLIIAKQIWRR